MDFQAMFVSAGISILLLVPIATKWQIGLSRSLLGAVVVGIISGVITDMLSGFFGGLGIAGIISLEVFFIIGLTASTVAYMFYRDPERDAPSGDGVIVSPADGSILYIKEVQQGSVPLSTKKGHRFKLRELAQTGFIKDGGYLIGIGMNLLNVHVNRAPIRGRVEMVKHTKGEFLSLRRPEAVLKNERVTTVLDDGRFRVAVVQIASRLVRRIDTYVSEGQMVDIGQRIGIIRFGSQVDLVIPGLADVRIKVRPGDEVKAGVSVLVEYGS